jgi:hypothetical protein
MRKPLLCVALLGTAACGPDLEPELAARVAEADVIFHVGCAERSAFSAELCEDERRVCGDVFDDAALALADGPIVVELLIDDVESASLLTWFIAPDGSGELYAERGTDFPLECFWQACGLTKTAFAAGDLIDDDGSPVLRPAPAQEGLDADVGDICE